MEQDNVVASVERPQPAIPENMIWIPGGTFRMGSDHHYPDEAPTYCVTVDGFSIDRAPVTNRQFTEFVRATGPALDARDARVPVIQALRAPANAPMWLSGPMSCAEARAENVFLAPWARQTSGYIGTFRQDDGLASEV